MSAYDVERRRDIFRKTNGRCHICRGRLVFKNYGILGARGAWEVDHGFPLVDGGTGHLNNLHPAHISCNRRRQDKPSRSARLVHGTTRAPLSSAAAGRARFRQAVAGAFTGSLLGARMAGPAGFWIGLIGGGIAAYALNPES